MLLLSPPAAPWRVGSGEAGPADGERGAWTRSAVIRFQSREGVDQSGRLDRATRQRLRGTKGFSEADLALAAAIEAVRALEIPHLDFDDAVDGEVIH